MKYQHLTIMMAIGAAIALPAMAQESQEKSPMSMFTSTQTARAGDSKVLEHLNKANLTEIEMGQMAQKNGEAQSVKDYGQTLENDHKKNQDQVKELADQFGINLKSKDESMTSVDKQKMEKLEKLQGSSFDKAFAKAMVEDHKKDISRLEADRKNVTGTTAALIDQTLPVLKQHLDTAQQLTVELKTQKNPS